MPPTYSLIRTARRIDANSINLAKRRTWYGEGDAGEQQNGQQNGGTKPDGKYNPSTLEDALKIISALSKRVEEREADANKYKSERDSLTAAQRKQLEEDGKFRTIAEQQAIDLARLKPIEERAQALEKIIRESNEARVKNVPDAMKALIPTDYPPEKLQSWLNANEALLVKPPAPDYDAGKGSGGSGGNPLPKLTDDERTLLKAAGGGMTEKEYAEMKQQRGQPIQLEKKP